MDYGDDLENKAMEFFKRMHQLKRNFQQFRSLAMNNLEVSRDQMIIMTMLAHRGRMKITDISEHVGLSISTISGLLDRMEEKGIIRRARSEEDRRVVYVTLEDNYYEIVDGMRGEMKKNISKILSRMAEDDIDTVFRAMDILNEALSEEDV